MFPCLCLIPASPVRVCHVLCVCVTSRVCLVSLPLSPPPCLSSHVSMFPSLCLLPLCPQPVFFLCAFLPPRSLSSSSRMSDCVCFLFYFDSLSLFSFTSSALLCLFIPAVLPHVICFSSPCSRVPCPSFVCLSSFQCLVSYLPSSPSLVLLAKP